MGLRPRGTRWSAEAVASRRRHERATALEGFLPNRQVALELVGRGWWPLLDGAFDAAERLGLTVLQIKEKTGGLRVHHWERGEDGRPPAAGLDVSMELGRRSLQICEACGAPGELRRELPWHKTLCDKCLERRERGETWEQVFGFLPYTTPRR
jgi:hypothetical protein